ncbi:sugar O-acyltransferase (sialic acid O-acetyltransferase NeuD family) [Ulvibacter sp. MAR_2010_11]|uniref:acetyltransferase n=1 Tax=Ulvibacter sp. MAR_2010_11 TaxID=1250229 RepID=UPI000C2C6540|nr:acetyltransferase [Ulvibacter sp. MAR_2010_11]PKA84353.1 sugar O-acyltransferase (sialic acid O-acetyltransferase NeuD family) [Ulvibacter sp. MAR_2010_11]
MKEIVIVGAGGFGREVKCLIEVINSRAPEKLFSIIGFVDDGIDGGTKIHDLPVLGTTKYIETLDKKVSLVLAIGNPKVKKELYTRFKNFDFPNIIHPSVFLENYNIKIGKGCIICEGTIITCDVEINNFTIINLACTVGHDTKIGAFSSIMPAVNVSGEVVIEECVYIGTGAKIVNRVVIGEGSTIGAGAVVSKSIPPNCTAVGVPANPIKFSK